MSNKASPAAIGAFVLGAVALLVGGIIAFSGGKLLQAKTSFVSYFPGTVAGLAVGAPVQFQGVQIGEVTSITLDYYVEEGRFSIPVYYDVWPDRLRTSDRRFEGGAESAQQKAERTRELVEKHGLRAVLTSVSLVTGQYVVSLELRPDTEFSYVGADDDGVEIPAVEATRDKIGDLFQNLDLQGLVSKATSALDGITAFVNDPKFREMPDHVARLVSDLDAAIQDAEARIDQLATRGDAAIADYQTLARTATERVQTLADSLEATSAKLGALSDSVNAKVDPIATSAIGAFGAGKQALDEAEQLLAPDSATRTNLDVMLEEAAGAARSLRILADYLEQNPDALIKGKY